MENYLGFIEFFVVALFALAGASLNWSAGGSTGKRKRSGRSSKARAGRPDGQSLLPRPRHPERQHRLHQRHPEAIERQAFVHQGHGLAEQFCRYHRPRIKRRVFQRPDDARRRLRCERCARPAIRCVSARPWRRLERPASALADRTSRPGRARLPSRRRASYRIAVPSCVAPRDHCQSVKPCFERRIAAVHVEIAVALPAQMRMVQRDLNARAWRDRPPPMIAVFVECESLLRDRRSEPRAPCR